MRTKQNQRTPLEFLKPMRFISECLRFRNIIEAPDTIWWAAQVKGTAAMVRPHFWSIAFSIIQDKPTPPMAAEMHVDD
jgi:hypothetical protein